MPNVWAAMPTMVLAAGSPQISDLVQSFSGRKRDPFLNLKSEYRAKCLLSGNPSSRLDAKVPGALTLPGSIERSTPHDMERITISFVATGGC